MAGYGNIGDFEGRERRFDFWAYALPVFLISPVVASVIGTAILPPDETGLTAQPWSADTVVVGRTIWFLVVVGLLAAKVRRRLRDAGRGSVWAMLVVIPYAAATVGAAFASDGDAIPLWLLLANAATLTMLLVLIVVLLFPEPGGDWRPSPLRASR